MLKLRNWKTILQKKDKYLDLIYEEPVVIGKLLGFEDLTDIHNEWLKLMMFERVDRTLLAHRGSYKTTCLSIAIGLIMIIFPNKNIIFIRKTDVDVTEVVKQVSKMLQSELIRHIVRQIYGVELVLVKDTSFELTTNLRTSARGASQLLGLGIKTSITGKHADLVITDDIVNIKDRISKAERDITSMSYMELQNIKNRGGRILNTGTTWHKEDCISKHMPNKLIYDCYQTGLIDRETLEQLRRSMTPSLFSANYELKHIADEDALFTAPIYLTASELKKRNTTAEAIIANGICHIDASYGGADGTAFTIIKKQGDNFIMFGKRWNKHVDDCISEILLLRDKYKAGTILCERNADKGYLEKELFKLGAIVEGYSENTNKFIKISTYLRKYWDKTLWLEDTDPDYMNEILDYTENAEHDDSPDSASCLIRKLEGKRAWIY